MSVNEYDKSSPLYNFTSLKHLMMLHLYTITDNDSLKCHAAQLFNPIETHFFAQSQASGTALF